MSIGPRARAAVIGLAALWIGCLPLRSPLAPASDSDGAAAEHLSALEHRLQQADSLEAAGQDEAALDACTRLFLDLDEAELPSESDAVDRMRLDTARRMARLLAGSVPDSSETDGIHSLAFTLEQLSDSSADDSTLDAWVLGEDLGESFAEESADSLLEELEPLASDTLSTPLPGIPDAEQASVDRMVEYFTAGRGRKYYGIWLERWPQVAPTIRRVLREEGLPDDLVFLAMIESGFRLEAKSRAKAVGPWQFMSGTAKVFGLKVDYWTDERLDLEASTRAAGRFLRSLHERYGDWYLAMAAYNWGPGRVDRALRRGGTEYWNLPRMPRETRNYVPTYLAARRVFRDLEAHGFALEPDRAEERLERVEIPGALNWDRLAGLAGLPEARLRELNPHVTRFCTAPDGCAIRVPAEAADALSKGLATLPASAFQEWARHSVRRGDTLGGIASRYGVSLRELLKANGLSSRSIIRPGQTVLVPRPSGGGGGGGDWAEAAPVSRGDGTPVHRVRRGEALERIAREHGVSVGDLVRWNGLERPDRIRAGQELVLADPVAPVASTSASRTPRSAAVDGEAWHVVVRGETAGGIATRYGTSLSELQRLNGLDGRARIYPGQRLRLPGDARGAARVVHVVGAGDTLWDLARHYNVSITDIRRWNNLRDNRIRAGAQLVIYLSEEG